MRSTEDPGGASVLEGHDESAADRRQGGAEIIDLIYLPVGARPQPAVELDYEEVLEARALDCASYNACLCFAAKVHWRGFSCRRCPKFLQRGDEAEPAATQVGGGLAAVIRLR